MTRREPDVTIQQDDPALEAGRALGSVPAKIDARREDAAGNGR